VNVNEAVIMSVNVNEAVIMNEAATENVTTATETETETVTETAVVDQRLNDAARRSLAASAATSTRRTRSALRKASRRLCTHAPWRTSSSTHRGHTMRWHSVQPCVIFASVRGCFSDVMHRSHVATRGMCSGGLCAEMDQSIRD
jgi:hypothetical protein